MNPHDDRDVATAGHLEQLDAQAFQRGAVHQKAVRARASPGREHRRNVAVGAAHKRRGDINGHIAAALAAGPGAALGRLMRTVKPDGATVELDRDALGRILRHRNVTTGEPLSLQNAPECLTGPDGTNGARLARPGWRGHRGSSR